MLAGMKRMAGVALVLGAAVGAAACSSHAVAAGAGAGAAYYFTSRGAEGLASAGIDEVASRAQAVMTEMSITPSGTDSNDGGAEREFHGKSGDLDVTIELEQKSESQTLVQVTAQKNMAQYDKDFARQIVEKIVTK